MTFRREIVGSFSVGAAGNPTVAIMEAAFEHEGLAWTYVNCEVEPADLAAAVVGATAMGWQGFNCSMPHKQAVIPLLNQLSPTAELTTAVNCVVRDANGWTGHNTDAMGFLTSVSEMIDIDGIDVLVIGSGGVAHAIAAELAAAQAAHLHLVGRNAVTVAALAKLVAGRTATTTSMLEWGPITIPPQVRLVVNATPVGSTPDTDATVTVDWGSLPADAVVADVVIDPPQTRFLNDAAAAGATTVDGTGMLVNQAAENLRLWTGVDPDRGPMRAALDIALAAS